MKIEALLITLIGILLILPLIGITQLGTPVEGPAAWILAIAVLILGIGRLTGKL